MIFFRSYYLPTFNFIIECPQKILQDQKSRDTRRKEKYRRGNKLSTLSKVILPKYFFSTALKC